MGMSHARAYQAIDDFELVGLCTRDGAARSELDEEFPDVPRYEGLAEALQALRPDAVSINTYTERHAPMALEAVAAGAHVFCEKPLADTLEAAERVVAAARQNEQGAAGRLHLARSSVMDTLRRDRPRAWQAARHEPQSAIFRLVLASA